MSWRGKKLSGYTTVAPARLVLFDQALKMPRRLRDVCRGFKWKLQFPACFQHAGPREAKIKVTWLLVPLHAE